MSVVFAVVKIKEKVAPALEHFAEWRVKVGHGQRRTEVGIKESGFSSVERDLHA